MTETPPAGRTGPEASSAAILVVDDNAINQKVAVGLLKRLGYRADVASSGEEALGVLARSRYDLVFMDCQMPGMDGFAATRELRGREDPGARTPVVAMTGRVTDEDRARCLAAGMDDYISKPILIEELRQVLDRWL